MAVETPVSLMEIQTKAKSGAYCNQMDMFADVLAVMSEHDDNVKTAANLDKKQMVKFFMYVIGYLIASMAFALWQAGWTDWVKFAWVFGGLGLGVFGMFTWGRIKDFMAQQIQNDPKKLMGDIKNIVLKLNKVAGAVESGAQLLEKMPVIGPIATIVADVAGFIDDATELPSSESKSA